ncbi:hypothetical protein [Fredinandcohnia sp. 179-A 10B2 NHS]|uniref:hypothetical protein n=1 Tax=Fredinandcohnia sp. 179-A 10B2 NHS TaxID=3235176 RepID=UPI0039A3525A
MEKEFYAIQTNLEWQLAKGENELKYIKSIILNRRETLKQEADECINIIGQLKANIDYLKRFL